MNFNQKCAIGLTILQVRITLVSVAFLMALSIIITDTVSDIRPQVNEYSPYVCMCFS